MAKQFPKITPVLQTRFEVARRLRVALTGRNLHEFAEMHGVTKGVNKGWVGMTLEKEAQLVSGSLPQKDGQDFELKSTSLVLRNGNLAPKETLAVTSLNPEKILAQSFEDSTLWDKLSRLIIVGVEHKSPTICEVRFITPVDVTDPQLVQQIREFWLEIKQIIGEGKLSEYSSKGTSKNFIQLRTKGSAGQTTTCPITKKQVKSRAFYMTKNFIRYCLGLM